MPIAMCLIPLSSQGAYGYKLITQIPSNPGSKFSFRQTSRMSSDITLSMDQVFRAGKAHAAQPEDVYGCLYFFLSDQLRAFARHIRQHRISFYVFSSEACALAQGISQGMLAECGVPSTTRFDRIDVSNIMDLNYIGIRGVMNAWGPLLAKTDNAALTGYFMNWAVYEKGRVADAGPSALKGTMDLMNKCNRVCCQAVHLVGTMVTDLASASSWSGPDAGRVSRYG